MGSTLTPDEGPVSSLSAGAVAGKRRFHVGAWHLGFRGKRVQESVSSPSGDSESWRWGRRVALQ